MGEGKHREVLEKEMRNRSDVEMMYDCCRGVGVGRELHCIQLDTNILVHLPRVSPTVPLRRKCHRRSRLIILTPTSN